jgi:stage IV sporulation protein FB
MADERAHIHIGGVPVRVDWSFWLLAVLLGVQGRQGWLLVAWVAIVLVSVLVHELGHAFTMRAFQQRPHVMLYAFGGVTFGDTAPRSRAESIVISLAGPLSALLLLGLPAYVLRDGVWAQETYNRYVIIHDIAWVNIIWSVLNLMPVLPLDGGNIAAALVGPYRARIVSVVFAGAAAAFFFASGNQFGALYAALFFFMNFAALNNQQQQRRVPNAGHAPPPVRIADVGRPTTDDVASLAHAFLSQPSGPPDLGPATDAARAGKVMPVATQLLASGPDGARAAAILQSHLHLAGYFPEAAAVAQLLYTDGRTGRVQPAFDAATALARAGDTNNAMAWLNRAIDEGFDIGSLLDGEPDLAPLRTLPSWPTTRARVR